MAIASNSSSCSSRFDYPDVARVVGNPLYWTLWKGGFPGSGSSQLFCMQHRIQQARKRTPGAAGVEN
jgi:hypothetical protein